MNIVYAGNRRVFDGLLISILSLIKVNCEPLDIFVLTMDLTDLDPEYAAIPQTDLDFIEAEMKKVNPDSHIIRIDAREVFNQKLAHCKNLANRYTPYALLRLLLADIPDMPDKMLYLDTDTVIHQRIAELYDQDIGNYEYAASKDRYGRFFFNPWYCNTGVLLLNLKKIRETGLFSKVIRLLNAKKVFLSDQTGIDRMTQRKKIMPRRYNEQKSVRPDTVIRHFSMQFRILPKFHFVNVKPWDIERVHTVYHCHDFDDIFDQFIELKSKKGA